MGGSIGAGLEGAAERVLRVPSPDRQLLAQVRD